MVRFGVRFWWIISVLLFVCDRIGIILLVFRKVGWVVISYVLMNCFGLFVLNVFVRLFK